MPAFQTFSSPLGHFSLPVSSVSGKYPVVSAACQCSLHAHIVALRPTCERADVSAGLALGGLPDLAGVDDGGHGERGRGVLGLFAAWFCVAG